MGEGPSQLDDAALRPSLMLELYLGMLSPFLTNSSSFDEMASLSRPLIVTDRSTPKSADKYMLSMSVVPDRESRT